MFGMGTMLRKTGAFFMRRSFSNDELYWDIFREYMYALVANYHIGVEFFIEARAPGISKLWFPKLDYSRWLCCHISRAKCRM